MSRDRGMAWLSRARSREFRDYWLWPDEPTEWVGDDWDELVDPDDPTSTAGSTCSLLCNDAVLRIFGCHPLEPGQKAPITIIVGARWEPVEAVEEGDDDE